MENSLERQFLTFSCTKLRELASRIDVCLAALSNEQIWKRGGENENAIGNLALHLCGNVRQWILSGLGGEADMRQRSGEFAAQGGVSGIELREKLNATVSRAVEVIEGVDGAQLLERRNIQGYDVSGLEAIYHVVEHFSMHTGQIIFAAKAVTGADFGFYGELSGTGRREKN
jgi:uncharacterized damage-inducible protein DinB